MCSSDLAGAMIWLCSMTAGIDPDVWRDPLSFDAQRFLAPDAPKLTVFVSVEDGTDPDPATIGATEYEAALAAASSERAFAPRSEEDLYILYTGGTTGMPKGVLWRNADANVECFGGSRADTLAGIVAEATGGLKSLLAPPFMHGAEIGRAHV